MSKKSKFGFTYFDFLFAHFSVEDSFHGMRENWKFSSLNKTLTQSCGWCPIIPIYWLTRQWSDNYFAQICNSREILGAVHILRNTIWGGGLPDLLQYYIGGEGSSETPKSYYVIYGRPLISADYCYVSYQVQQGIKRTSQKADQEIENIKVQKQKKKDLCEIILCVSIRGAFFVWRAPIMSWPRIMCSQVGMLKVLQPSQEIP